MPDMARIVRGYDFGNFTDAHINCNCATEPPAGNTVRGGIDFGFAQAAHETERMRDDAMHYRDHLVQVAYEEELKKRKEAEEKSRMLLYSHLTRDQISSLKRHGYFMVKSQYDRAYKIHSSQSMNVYWMHNNDSTPMCVIAYGIPLYDQMLMQKLMLEYDEDRFIDIAHASGRKPPLHKKEKVVQPPPRRAWINGVEIPAGEMEGFTWVWEQA